jgi:hypothetical protein
VEGQLRKAGSARSRWNWRARQSYSIEAITDTTLMFANGNEQDFKKFISWISQSVSVQSQSVGMSSNHEDLPLAPFDDFFPKEDRSGGVANHSG